METKATAYITSVCPLLEYSSAAWDPYLSKDMHNLERVQRHAVRFVASDYRRITSVTILLSQLEWPLLSTRRRNGPLVAFFKAVSNIPPIPVGQVCPCSHLTRVKQPVEVYTFVLARTSTSTLLLQHTIIDWKSLPFSL